MSYNFRCRCGQWYRAEAGQEGKVFACRSCGASITTPAAGGEGTAAAAGSMTWPKLLLTAGVLIAVLVVAGAALVQSTGVGGPDDLDLGPDWRAAAGEQAPEQKAEERAPVAAPAPAAVAPAEPARLRTVLRGNEGVRTRKDPNATVEMGNYTNVVLCMAIESLRTGRRIRFNPQTRRMEA